MNQNWSNITSSSQPQQFSSFLSQSSSQHPSYPQIFHSSTSCRENHELPATASMSHLLLSGFVEEKHKNTYGDFQTEKTENCETQLLYPPTSHHVYDEREENNGNLYVENEELQAIGSTSNQFLQVSSPNSYVTGLRSNMLDFSGNIVEIQQQHPDQSSVCNSYDNGGSWKKAKIQPSSTAFKVKKEKIGDRIAALHQLVSPYGKTDTASVLLEVIGYIRFLQNQIEVLILPHLGAKSCRLSLEGQKSSVFAEDIDELCMMQELRAEEKEHLRRVDFENGKIRKDLRSKGLCLVPTSVTLKVGNKNCGADFWARSAFTG